VRSKILGVLGVGLALAGCTAMNPQNAARQQAETYYGRSYDQLSGREKMQLENHLARQSNGAWRTTAQVASGAGRFLQGGRGIGARRETLEPAYLYGFRLQPSFVESKYFDLVGKNWNRKSSVPFHKDQPSFQIFHLIADYSL
jgi:hypothetical protein